MNLFVLSGHGSESFAAFFNGVIKEKKIEKKSEKNPKKNQKNRASAYICFCRLRAKSRI